MSQYLPIRSARVARLTLLALVAARASTALAQSPSPPQRIVLRRGENTDIALTTSPTVTDASKIHAQIGDAPATVLELDSQKRTAKVVASPATPYGLQPLLLTAGTAGSETTLARSVVLVLPRVTGIEVAARRSDGNDLSITLDDPIPGGLPLQVTVDDKPAELRKPYLGERQLTVKAPPVAGSGKEYVVSFLVDGQPLVRDYHVLVADLWKLAVFALLAWFILVSAAWLLYQARPGSPLRRRLQAPGQEPTAVPDEGRGGFWDLLLEPENNTYSLGKFQFWWWSSIFLWAYLFLFLVQYFVEGIHGLPQSDGLPLMPLISAATLVASQAAGQARGVKGAGELRPSLRDLFTDGRLVSVDRLQKLLWTLVIGVGFVLVTVHSSKKVPSIDEGLLWLMGLSSATYVGGKWVRGGGPVVDRVLAENQSLILIGSNLSPKGEVHVYMDGQDLALDPTRITAQDPDPAAPGFMRRLEISMPAGTTGLTSKLVTVKNTDGRTADCVITPPPAAGGAPNPAPVPV